MLLQSPLRRRLPLRDLQQEQTHAFACDKVAILNHGELVAVGTPYEVLIPDIIEPVFQITMYQNSVAHHEHPFLSFAKRK